jgi:hypothetical protein
MTIGRLFASLAAPGSRLPAPGSRLPAPGSRLPAPGSRLPDYILLRRRFVKYLVAISYKF